MKKQKINKNKYLQEELLFKGTKKNFLKNIY